MKKVIVLIFTILFSASGVCAPINIYFWHSMAGQLGAAMNKTISEFNHSQNQYKVIGVFKGNYAQAFTSLVAAFRAHQQPAMSQIFEVGTATMLASKQAIVPVYKLFDTFHVPVKQKDFLPAIGLYYSNKQGQLMAMPLNASSPILYYNKAAFVKAGLDPNKPPKTWPQLETDGQKLLKAGFKCAYTTTWPSWIQLEVFSAWHNIPFASKGNGFGSMNVKVLYDNPLVLKQLRALVRWQKEGIFQYGGRNNNAQSLFTSGRCAMYTQSSGAYSTLQHNLDFPVGVGELPYWPDVKSAPQNTSIGGGAIWVMRGKSSKVYKGVAEFFEFLLKPSVQLQWQKHTGYLPLTHAAYQYAKQRGFYEKDLGVKTALAELMHKSPTRYSRGIRLGDYVQIRTVNNIAFEAAFSGMMTPKQALAYAAKHANQYLQRFRLMESD